MHTQIERVKFISHSLHCTEPTAPMLHGMCLKLYGAAHSHFSLQINKHSLNTPIANGNCVNCLGCIFVMSAHRIHFNRTDIESLVSW